MDNPKWWNMAVAVLTVALAVMLFFIDNLSPVRILGAQAALAVFAASWYTVGRLAWHLQWAAVAFITSMTVTSGVATAFYPAMAAIQCVAFPLIWVITRSLRNAILANIALAVSVGIGLAVSFGLTAESALQAAFTASLSLGFSIALGLWITRIFDLSTERQALFDDLQAAQGQLAALHRDSGVASERERLSRELHDTIAQSLTGLVMLVQGARRDLEAGDQDAARAALAMIEESTRETLVETRSLVASGAAVEVPGGIIPALNRLAERFERETGVAVAVTTNDVPNLDRGTEVVLLRCTQEALANIRKHANANAVSLAARGHNGGVELRVTDDGNGFIEADATGGFGLAGVRERLALVDGSLEVESGTAGTTLTVRVPVEVSV
ncbi:MAG: sensor histidine kinase [Microbacteriaceae bacterium]|nr:sensor histidine kinase [Microbacteriaceae bacterium]